MSSEFNNPENGLFTPYSALLIFLLESFISNFIWNTYFMLKPIESDPVKFRNYISNSTLKTHLMSILGYYLVSWHVIKLNISEKAGYPVSYGLGQGATMVAAAWGVFVWKNLKEQV